MITETQQTSIDTITGFAEKDENEQAAIIKRFPAKSLKTMLKYLSVDCSVQSPPPAVEEVAYIREFLQINGPLAMNFSHTSLEVLLDPTSTDSFYQTTVKIRSMMQKLDSLILKWFKCECKLLLT
jgi:hypothetical protein